jgi:hypothetical protein
MKKLTKIVLCLAVLLLVTGCTSNKKETKKEKSKGKCKITECINLIGLKDNLEKVNETIGFEGKKGKDDTYTWKLTSKDKVEVVFSDTNTIKIKLLDDSIKNNKTSFKKYDEIEKKLKDGEKITIEDLNKAFKSNGVLIEKTSIKEVYKWVDKEDGYLEATINGTNGKCYRLNGMI